MANAYDHYKNYGVEQFLEDPDFRRWARQADAEQEAFWQAFLQRYPQQAATVSQAAELIRGISTYYHIPVPSAKQQAADFDKLSRHLPAADTAAIVRPLRSRWWLKLAAAAALILTLAGLSWYLSRPAKWQYVTTNGEQRQVYLPDSTLVYLNANSRLEVPKKSWAAHHREVYLDGEAYFEVRPRQQGSKRLPFQVHTRKVTIEVLGTAFNIRERRGQTRVFLEEGIIQLQWVDPLIPAKELQPGDLVSYTSGQSRPVYEKVEGSRQLAWKTGRLRFEETPLKTVLQEIQDIYGISIQYDQPALQARKVTSDGIPVDNLQLALLLVEKALEVKIVPQGPGSYQVVAP